MGENGKHWLFENGNSPQIINAKEFADALSALNNLNQGKANYTAPPAGTDLEEDLRQTLKNEFGAYGDNFISISDKLGTITQSLGDLATQRLQTSNYNTTNNSRTIEAPISVEINNPQAWDTEHIQELADKVSDQLSTAIVNAIGGDSNSY